MAKISHQQKRDLVWYCPVNLGQSSQDFKKSLNRRLTWGKSPSPSLGACKRQSHQRVTNSPSFLTMPQTSDTRGNDEPLRNLSEKKFKRPREVYHLSKQASSHGFISPTLVKDLFSKTNYIPSCTVIQRLLHHLLEVIATNRITDN